MKPYPSHRYHQHSTSLCSRERNHPPKRAQGLGHSMSRCHFKLSTPTSPLNLLLLPQVFSRPCFRLCRERFARIFYCITWNRRCDHEMLVLTPIVGVTECATCLEKSLASSRSLYPIWGIEGHFLDAHKFPAAFSLTSPPCCVGPLRMD
jgi:hypothetical protein